ncbi:hypothetical protein NIES4072_11510 [Nostoc commune NIES-4072]|uniref:Uncharacterized protein n=1 Tax=Nostoc commune NIES-4072 TaxID=2005467 RepID=A0A2R5FFY9_NOSCO|nr:hypothetical protein NIES4070_15310 [Nostoc commune HK-02]GBG17492.1 hypothetical protein NIES4072_11510 [Nostoc commune NIES-4072]
MSDKAVEKWCKAYGVEKPPRGYWVKKVYGKVEGQLISHNEETSRDLSLSKDVNF